MANSKGLGFSGQLIITVVYKQCCKMCTGLLCRKSILLIRQRSLSSIRLECSTAHTPLASSATGYLKTPPSPLIPRPPPLPQSPPDKHSDPLTFRTNMPRADTAKLNSAHWNIPSDSSNRTIKAILTSETLVENFQLMATLKSMLTKVYSRSQPVRQQGNLV